jgi:hypothetical protein
MTNGLATEVRSSFIVHRSSFNTPMATLEFFAAAAGAWVVAAHVSELGLLLARLGGVPGHDFSRSALLAQQVGHHIHRLSNVVEEFLVTGAQVIKARLAGRGVDKPVSGTAAVAGKAHFAVQAILGQRILFILAKLALLV